MAIGTPVNLGSTLMGAIGTSASITTGADSPAGNCVLVGFGCVSTTSARSVSDSAGNTYTPLNTSTSGAVAQLFYCANAAHLPSGGTITVSWTSSDTAAIAACSISGLDPTAPSDINGAAASATGTSFTKSTGTLANANEIVIALFDLNGTSGGMTEASGFTTIGGAAPTIDGATGLNFAYQIVSSTASVTYAPSWTTSRTTNRNLYSFVAASGGSSYSVSQAESGSAADTPGSLAVLPSAVAETGSAADTPSSLAVLLSTVSETGVAADTSSSRAALAGAVADALAATDTLGAAAVLTVAIAEAGSASDGSSTGGLYALSLVEAASAADLFTAAYIPSAGYVGRSAARTLAFGGASPAQTLTFIGAGANQEPGVALAIGGLEALAVGGLIALAIKAPADSSILTFVGASAARIG